MPGQFPKYSIADINGNRIFRQRRYRKTRRGDVIRVPRINPANISTNQIGENLGISSRDARFGTIQPRLSDAQLRQGNATFSGGRAKPGTGSSPAFPFSDSVFDVLSNFPEPVTSDQLAAIVRFMDRITLSGMINELDHFNLLTTGLGWPEANANTDWFGGRTAIPSGGAVLGVDGYDIDNTGQVDLQWNPQLDSDNFTNSQACAGAYCVESRNNVDDVALYSTDDTETSNRRTELRQDPGNNRVQFWTNGGPGNYVGQDFISDMTFYSANRDFGGMRLWRDGSVAQTVSAPNNGLHNANMILGPGDFEGKISVFFASGGLTGGQQNSFFNDVVALQQDFGVI